MKIEIIALLFITGAFFSCKKREGNVIIDGQGDGGNYVISRSDTFTVLGRTIREDSLPGNGLPYNLIGVMTDPLLGTTIANTYAASTLFEPSSDFPNTRTPDSAVLYIPIIDGLNFYGDRTANQKWNIYPLKAKLESNTVYYQNSKFSVETSKPSSYTGKIFSTKHDSVRYKKGKIQMRPGIRIRLSTDMAKTLMQMPKDAYQSDDNLNKYFPGIAILPENTDLPPGKGGIGVYDLVGSGSIQTRANIMLYYSDTETFVFTLSGSSKTVTTGNTGPYPSQVQEQLNSSKHHTVTYVQSLSGLKTLSTLPYLFNLVSDKNIAVNKAQITFYVDPNSVSSDFPAPVRLNLFRPPSATSKRNFILTGGNSVNFGGWYDEKSKSYSFNITRHIQDVLNAYALDKQNLNYGLFLAVPTAEPVMAARAAIDHSRTKLVITYTKLN